MSDFETIFRFLYSGTLEVLRLVPICVLISLVLGVLIGIIQSVRVPVINQLISAYVILMCGIPPLLLLLIVFFIGGFEGEVTAAIFALSIYHAAYISEIFRGGIVALPRGQFEAADMIALQFHQKMVYVIIPQVWKSVLPAITGQYIILVKDTALVSAIGVMEILYNARQAMQIVDRPLLIYFLVGCLFFVICFSLERLEVWIQKRMGQSRLGDARAV